MGDVERVDPGVPMTGRGAEGGQDVDKTATEEEEEEEDVEGEEGGAADEEVGFSKTPGTERRLSARERKRRAE